jgi:hypothetical protein
MSEKNFHYIDRFFEKEEDFWAYVKEWEQLPLDEPTATLLLDRLKNDILVNLFICEYKGTNKPFQELLGDMLNMFFQQLPHLLEGSLTRSHVSQSIDHSIPSVEDTEGSTA